MKSIIFTLLFIFSIPAWAKTILYVGDSHSVGPFGWALDQKLRDDGNAVFTAASCGSIAKWWYTGQQTPCGFFKRDLEGVKTEATKAATPLIENLIQSVRPEVVFIELGGNYLTLPSDKFVIDDIRKIVATVRNSGAQCFWITQPDTRANRAAIPRIAKLTREAIGNDCVIFESFLVTKYPTTGGDGTHYWFPAAMELAKNWAQAAFNAYKESHL